MKSIKNLQRSDRKSRLKNFYTPIFATLLTLGSFQWIYPLTLSTQRASEDTYKALLPKFECSLPEGTLIDVQCVFTSAKRAELLKQKRQEYVSIPVKDSTGKVTSYDQVKIAKTIIHPSFNPLMPFGSPGCNDYALLILEKPIFTVPIAKRARHFNEIEYKVYLSSYNANSSGVLERVIGTNRVMITDSKYPAHLGYFPGATDFESTMDPHNPNDQGAGFFILDTSGQPLLAGVLSEYHLSLEYNDTEGAIAYSILPINSWIENSLISLALKNGDPTTKTEKKAKKMVAKSLGSGTIKDESGNELKDKKGNPIQLEVGPRNFLNDIRKRADKAVTDGLKSKDQQKPLPPNRKNLSSTNNTKKTICGILPNGAGLNGTFFASNWIITSPSVDTLETVKINGMHYSVKYSKNFGNNRFKLLQLSKQLEGIKEIKLIAKTLDSLKGKTVIIVSPSHSALTPLEIEPIQNITEFKVPETGGLIFSQDLGGNPQTNLGAGIFVKETDGTFALIGVVVENDANKQLIGRLFTQEDLNAVTAKQAKQASKAASNPRASKTASGSGIHFEKYYNQTFQNALCLQNCSLREFIEKNNKLMLFREGFGKHILSELDTLDGATVFVPTNNAMIYLSQESKNHLLLHSGSATKLARNHVAANQLNLPMKPNKNVELTTLEGTTITLATFNGHISGRELERIQKERNSGTGETIWIKHALQHTPTLNIPFCAKVVFKPILCTNGILYLIDRPILTQEIFNSTDKKPFQNARKPGLISTGCGRTALSELNKEKGSCKRYIDLLLKSGLQTYLERVLPQGEEPISILVLGDKNMEMFEKKLNIDLDKINRDDLQYILKHFIIPNKKLTSTDNGQFMTVAGSILHFDQEKIALASNSSSASSWYTLQKKNSNRDDCNSSADNGTLIILKNEADLLFTDEFMKGILVPSQVQSLDWNTQDKKTKNILEKALQKHIFSENNAPSKASNVFTVKSTGLKFDEAFKAALSHDGCSLFLSYLENNQVQNALKGLYPSTILCMPTNNAMTRLTQGFAELLKTDEKVLIDFVIRHVHPEVNNPWEKLTTNVTQELHASCGITVYVIDTPRVQDHQLKALTHSMQANLSNGLYTQFVKSLWKIKACHELATHISDTKGQSNEIINKVRALMESQNYLLLMPSQKTWTEYAQHFIQFDNLCVEDLMYFIKSHLIPVQDISRINSGAYYTLTHEKVMIDANTPTLGSAKYKLTFSGGRKAKVTSILPSDNGYVLELDEHVLSYASADILFGHSVIRAPGDTAYKIAIQNEKIKREESDDDSDDDDNDWL